MNHISHPRRDLPNGVSLSPLVVEATSEHYHGRRVWRLVQEFRLSVTVDGCDEQDNGYLLVDISVPAGFESDYASIPRVFWMVWGPDQAAEAAVIHDWLYAHPAVDRHFADTMLRLVMRLTGKSWLMQWAFYLAVRFGGRWARKTKGGSDG
jgi:hypothetical protein